MKTYTCSRVYPKNAKVITVPTYHHIQAPSKEVAVEVMRSRFPSDLCFDVREEPTQPTLTDLILLRATV